MARRVILNEFPYGDWKIRTSKSHIMTKVQEEKIATDIPLPHLPDMLFSQNALSIQHRDGFGISFNPIDALKMVNATEDLVHVSMSKEWLEARSNHAHINKIAKPYDWTFTPINFRGTLLSEDDTPNLTVGETEEKIDYEHLKIKEKILYSDELILFEDELDDNGCSKLSVKIRAMPSGFFCLQRFYLRVDNTLIRIVDTRLYHDVSRPYLLREYSERESRTGDLKCSPATFTNENEIVQHLELKKEITEKLAFPGL